MRASLNFIKRNAWTLALLVWSAAWVGIDWYLGSYGWAAVMAFFLGYFATSLLYDEVEHKRNALRSETMTRLYRDLINEANVR